MGNLTQTSQPHANTDATEVFTGVTCPGCGLLCDDLVVERLADASIKISENGCPRSAEFFSQAAYKPSSPRVAGQETDLASAINEAASLLQYARQPLIGGLATEVHGMRAILEIADLGSATLDHMNSEAVMRNILAMQNSGWHISTLTEVRNRADLVLIIGGDIVSRFPRFFERNIWNRESMFGQDTAARDIIYLGGPQIDITAGISPKGIKPTLLACDNRNLPEVIAALLALASGKTLHAMEIAGIAVADLQTLVHRLATANYGVIAWSAADFDFPHAELTVQKIGELVEWFNKTTRMSGLPLAGSEGDITANQVSAWISGFPVRNSFKRRHPEYDPYRFAANRQLSSTEADMLIWINTFHPDRLPPETDIPTVVIGHPAMKFTNEPDVFIPVGIPGVDHAGIMFRSDTVVSLPLSKLRQTQLPSLADVLRGIKAKLGSRSSC